MDARLLRLASGGWGRRGWTLTNGVAVTATRLPGGLWVTFGPPSLQAAQVCRVDARTRDRLKAQLRGGTPALPRGHWRRAGGHTPGDGDGEPS